MLVDVLNRPLQTHKRQVSVTAPQLAKFAAFADDAFRQLELTVICPRCKMTPAGNNAATDSTWRLECACTVRVMKNPNVP